MGINRADIEMVNQSMANLGQSFTQKRQLDEQHSRDISQELLRKKMLEAETRRLDVEQSRETTAAAGHITQPFEASGPDGTGQGVYVGPAMGWKNMVDGAEKQGRQIKPITQAKKAPFSIETMLPEGKLVLNADSPDQLDQIVQHVKKMGGKAAPHTSGQYGPIATDEAATKLEDQADMMEQAGDSDTAGALRERAKALRSNITKPDPSQFQTVTDTQDAPPGTFGPKTTTTRKVPVGQAPAAAAPGATGGKVRMISPKGVAGFVPASQVEKAKAQGYKLAQ